MIREPAVAGRFYPGTSKALNQTLSELIPVSESPNKIQAIAAVSPHAGYVYSGAVAAETLSAVQVPQTVVVLGLNHHGIGAPVALSKAVWSMPLGDISPDIQLCDALVAKPEISHDESSHQHEHSIEVQLPFLQVLQPNLSIVPIVFSHLLYSTCEQVGKVLAEVITETSKEVLIVASSDMTHYESRASAKEKDSLALDQLDQLNPQGLYDIVHTRRISMCGIIPVTIALIAAKILGAKKAKLIRYTDSGEVSGDTDQVVGYAGLVIS